MASLAWYVMGDGLEKKGFGRFSLVGIKEMGGCTHICLNLHKDEKDYTSHHRPQTTVRKRVVVCVSEGGVCEAALRLRKSFLFFKLSTNGISLGLTNHKTPRP
jgi:hypothetical protein